MMVILHLYKAG